MTTILQIEASARIERSLSRGLARTFRNRFLEIEPTAEFIERDVGTRPLGALRRHRADPTGQRPGPRRWPVCSRPNGR